MKIYIGTDHAGLAQKEKIASFLRESGYEVSDCGAHEYDEADDYPDHKPSSFSDLRLIRRFLVRLGGTL